MVRAVNLTRRQTLMERGAVARSLWARGRGLLGRPALEPGQGLALIPGNAIHTFFMPAAIDVVHLDAGDRVVRLEEGMAPWRIGPWVRGARWVLELPPGTIAATGTRIGDTIALREA